MHQASAELFACDYFSCGCFHEWWPAQKDRPVPLHDDILIGHGRHVGSSCRAAAQHHGNLWDASWRHLSHVVENATKMPLSWENIALPGEVSSSWIHQIKAGKVILQGNFLCPQVLPNSNRIIRPPILKHHKYPLIVGSLATIMQNRPWIKPTPVTMPPELTY